MDKGLKDRWVSALRSGEYKQGKGVLGDIKADGSMSYCCLGVLCDVARPELEAAEISVGISSRGLLTVAGDVGVLTPSVAELLGMPNGTGCFNGMPVDEAGWHPDLTSLNDNGATFDRIADLIEYAL